jgi:hypothetical protein
MLLWLRVGLCWIKSDYYYYYYKEGDMCNICEHRDMLIIIIHYVDNKQGRKEGGFDRRSLISS